MMFSEEEYQGDMLNHNDTLVLQNEEYLTDLSALSMALKFLSRRCEEQGFYSPNRQPIVLEGLKIADKYSKPC
jgi:hypothetical protein